MKKNGINRLVLKAILYMLLWLLKKMLSKSEHERVSNVVNASIKF